VTAVPPGLSGRVAAWVVAGVRAELAAERERGGPPFPAAPYLQLVRALRAVAERGHETSTGCRASGELVTADQFARHTGRSPRSVRRDCLTGRLPATRLGRTWVIDTTMEEHNGSGNRTTR
jgi:hypothetical protein